MHIKHHQALSSSRKLLSIAIRFPSYLILLTSFMLISRNAFASPSPSVAPDGKYADVSGSEDFHVIIKNGKVISLDGCTPEYLHKCTLSELLNSSVASYNPHSKAIKVFIPGWQRNLVACNIRSTPNPRADFRSGYIYECDYNRGWVKKPSQNYFIR